MKSTGYLQIGGEGLWTIYKVDVREDGSLSPIGEWELIGWPESHAEVEEREMMVRLLRQGGGVTRHVVDFDGKEAVMLVVSAEAGIVVPGMMNPGGDCLLRALLIVAAIGGGLITLGYLIKGVVAALS